jgi:hypothetical protein
MRPIQVIAGLFLSAALVSPAHAVTGNELKEACDHPTSTYCGAYVSGSVDALAFGDEVRQGVCIPPIPYSQVMAVVEKYLHDHPEELHRAASLLIYKALKGAFPCP